MTRKKIFLPILVIIFFFAFGFIIVHTVKHQISSQISSCLQFSNTQAFDRCLNLVSEHEPKVEFIARHLKSPHLSQALTDYIFFKPLLPFSHYLLGETKPIDVLIFFQNDYELRANGGFFGSYAVIHLDKGQISYKFQDIYVPDGQLIGHVDPPAPIQASFKQGWFKLRDSDWEPDFTVASQTIRWFLEKGNEINPDVIITINFSTIKKIVALINGFRVPEYNLDINGDNIYSLLQNQAEINFFPGSTQKRDVLTAAGKAALTKLKTLSLSQYLDIAEVITSEIKHQNLLFNSLNQELQKVFETNNWAGKISLPPCKQDHCLTDNYLLVETNLGANKANCCTTRHTTHTISETAQGFRHQVDLIFDDQSLLENPLPPRSFGGNYISYLRFYLPTQAKDLQIIANPTLPNTIIPPTPLLKYPGDQIATGSAYGLNWIGFFHVTRAGSQSQISLSYFLPKNSEPYQLNLLKQHGLSTSPSTVNLNGKKYETDLDTDISYP